MSKAGLKKLASLAACAIHDLCFLGVDFVSTKGADRMIVYEDRNRVGHEAAEATFSKLVTTTPPANSIDRASYLCGMQAFCTRQLRRELASAMDALGSDDRPPLEDIVGQTVGRATPSTLTGHLS